MAIDAQDQLYIVDMTGRIQVFPPRASTCAAGGRRPSSTASRAAWASARDGNLLVADTHYFRVLVYTPEGELLERRTLGGQSGRGPGQFNFVTDAVQDSHGCYYVAEYGECDRIQKFAADGTVPVAVGRARPRAGAVRPAAGSGAWTPTTTSGWPTPATTASRCSTPRAAKPDWSRCWGDGRIRARSTVLPVRAGAGRSWARVRMRTGKSSRPEIHARRPVAGMLGHRRSRARRTVESLGDCAGPPAARFHSGHVQSSRAADSLCDASRRAADGWDGARYTG